MTAPEVAPGQASLYNGPGPGHPAQPGPHGQVAGLDARSLELLEWSRVLHQVAAHAATAMGREQVEGLHPLASLELARARQQDTSLAKALLEQGGEAARPPLEVPDVRELVRRAAAGSRLNGPELVRIARACDGIGRLRVYLARFAGPGTPAEALGRFSGGLAELGELARAIDGALDGDGQVTDQASPQLASIRMRLRRAVARVQEALQELVRSPVGRRALQEPIVTLRAGRYVVPVREECRDLVPGIVHDASASGATVFVEPLDVVEANNAVRAAQSQEEAEVERILEELSRAVARRAADLAESLATVGEVDAIVARARYSLQTRSAAPALNDRGRVVLNRARHPLLGDRAVPIDIAVGRDFLALVITGPNTGGKTVAMKTVGLLCAMGMAGLHVPADPGSEVAVFDEIWVDLGDQQDTVENLSTFSSHIRRIVPILDRAGPATLVLLDELGTGTDPEEGGALGCAILEHLVRRGARVVVTTHLGELKWLAQRSPGMANASVTFDPQTLSPTYRLVVGAPGPSQALAVAARLGMPSSVLEDARRRLGPDRVEMGQVVSELQTALDQARRRLQEAERQRQEARRLYDELKRAQADLAARRTRLLESARERADGLLRSARLEAEALLEQLRAAARARRMDQARRLRDLVAGLPGRLEQEIEATLSEFDPGSAPPAAPGGPGVVDPSPSPASGERVWVAPLRSAGLVLGPADEQGTVWVQVGPARIRVPQEKLAFVPEPQAPVPDGGSDSSGSPFGTSAGPTVLGKSGPPSPGNAGQLMVSKAASFSPELDLRGLTVDEALARLDRYLDDCLLAGARRVRIIHGAGTGALRQAVRGRLRETRGVRSFEPAAPHEGGNGATVVDLE